MKTIRPEKAKFVAIVNDVKELRLIGNANLDFWNKQLADKPYQPFDNNGFAEITVAATELVWKGFRFNEWTIFLTLAGRNNPIKEAGVLLLHAFNSNRFFAFCGRTFFFTPYYFGKINLQENRPCSMNVWTNNQLVFKAEMSETKRTINEKDEHWEGAVFLPNAQNEKYFIAKLSGKSKVCPFNESDKIELNSDEKYSIFEQLIKSNFTAKEWHLRSNAFHAKSKTYSVDNN